MMIRIDLAEEIEQLRYDLMFEPQIIPGRAHTYYYDADWTDAKVGWMRTHAEFGAGGLFFTVLDEWNSTTGAYVKLSDRKGNK